MGQVGAEMNHPRSVASEVPWSMLTAFCEGQRSLPQLLDCELASQPL